MITWKFRWFWRFSGLGIRICLIMRFFRLHQNLLLAYFCITIPVFICTEFHVIRDDFKDPDILQTFLSHTYSECNIKCKNSENCHDVYLEIGSKGDYKRCRLLTKREVVKSINVCLSIPTTKKTTTASCIIETNTGLDGTVLKSFQIIETWQDCNSICQQIINCKNWAYHKIYKYCKLKGDVTRNTAKNIIVSNREYIDVKYFCHVERMTKYEGNSKIVK